ncbi:hypothetical protein V8C42DRAFT_52291 [Trichoderma barbatum]
MSLSFLSLLCTSWCLCTCKLDMSVSAFVPGLGDEYDICRGKAIRGLMKCLYSQVINSILVEIRSVDGPRSQMGLAGGQMLDARWRVEADGVAPRTRPSLCRYLKMKRG